MQNARFRSRFAQSEKLEILLQREATFAQIDADLDRCVDSVRQLDHLVKLPLKGSLRRPIRIQGSEFWIQEPKFRIQIET